MNAVPADQLIVRLDPSGALSINGENVAPEAYVAALGQRLERQLATGRIVLFSADDEADYGSLVHAFDGAKQAGARALGMITDAPAGGSAVAPAPPPAASPR